MILVPQDFFNKVNQSHVPKPSINLDHEMDALLNNNNHMDEKEKWIKYQQALQRYLHFKEQDRQPLKVTLENSTSESSHKPELHQEIISAVPKLFKKKAEMLLNRLNTSNDIHWNSVGEVSIKGENLVGSNITDLVSDIVRARKTSNPVGWQKFTDLVKELNIPREFIGNPRRVLYMERRIDTTPMRQRPQRIQVRSSPLTRVVARGLRRPNPLGWRNQHNPQSSSEEEEVRQTMWERYKL